MSDFKLLFIIFRQTPWYSVIALSSLFMLGAIESSAIFSIAPIIDVFRSEDLSNASEITTTMVKFVQALGLPVKTITFIGIFIFLSVIKNLASIISKYYCLKIKYHVMESIIGESFGHFFSSSWKFFTSSNQGMLLNTFNRELEIVGGATGSMFNYLRYFVVLCFLGCTILVVSWKVGLTTAALFVVIYLPTYFSGRLSYRLGVFNTQTANEYHSRLQESFDAAKIILGFGRVNHFKHRILNAFKGHTKATIKSQLVPFIIHGAYEPLVAVILFALVYMAIYQFNNTLSEALVILYTMRLGMPLFLSFIAERNGIRNTIPSYHQILQLQHKAQDLQVPQGNEQFSKLEQDLIIRDLSFSYSPDKKAVEHINIIIPKGSMTAFVGKSGAGKSTMIDLLMGLYPIHQGDILINQKPLHHWDLLSYRQKIGYVPQDSFLFNMTIRENLLWVNPGASDEAIRQACAVANALEFIEQLEKGFDTIVGDRGVRLSGGQRQRIALARALMAQPEVLILDEATSALDSESEKLIQQAIERLAKSTTVIIIAHRLSTIMQADQIYVFEHGKMVEHGTYQQLIDRSGNFSALAKLQGLK